MMLGGLELLALPLTGVLSRGALKLVIYIGIGGVFGVIIGILLITAGIATWVSPEHRTFYGVAGVVLGLASFPASNLGGFFVCLLLSIIGGSLAFAWTPDPAVPVRIVTPPRPAPQPAPQEPPTLTDTEPLVPGLGPREPGGESSSHEGTRRMLALAALPLVMSAGVVGAHTALSSATAPAKPAQTCILGLVCLGSGPTTAPATLPTCLPSVLPTNLPKPLPTSLPTCLPTRLPAVPGLPTALPTVPGLPTSLPAIPGLPTSLPTVPGVPGLPGTGKKPAAKDPKAKSSTSGAGLVAPAATSVITASSATLVDFTYVGNVKMPTAAGGTVTMMKFTAASMTLSGAADAVTEAGHTAVTSSTAMAFDGNVVLYATRLSGKLAGIPLTFTPSTISGVLLKVASVITGHGTITMTSVVTDQAEGTADSLTYGHGGTGFSVVLH
jgi:hypothetical protein